MCAHLKSFLGGTNPAKFATCPVHCLPKSNRVEAAARGAAKGLPLLRSLGKVRASIHSRPSIPNRSRARTDMPSSGLCISRNFFFLIRSRVRLRSRKYARTSAGVLSKHLMVRMPNKNLVVEGEVDTPPEVERTPSLALRQDILHAIVHLGFRHALVSKKPLQFASPEVGEMVILGRPRFVQFTHEGPMGLWRALV